MPGILYGLVPAGRIENDKSESDDGRHAQTAAGFPHQFRSDAAADFNRQRAGRFGERENREAHYEKRARRSQFVCPR